jgi:hypothetical protein
VATFAFRAEYASALCSPVSEPNLSISFGRRVPGRSICFSGRYKSLRWRVQLPEPAEDRLRAVIALAGEPRAFGLSLLQGYVIEPLLGLVAPSSGHVLLPGAAIGSNGGATLLIGRSRSGKSSLSARAAARGLPVLGDDHVFVGGDGTCRAFPRRLRLYSDVGDTAPCAYARLSARQRMFLRTLGVVRTLSQGRVAPPLRIRLERFGAPPPNALPLDQIVVIERGEGETMERIELDRDEVILCARTVLAEQRAALDDLGGEWDSRIDRVRAAEVELLRAAFAHSPSATRLVVPKRWDPGRAVSSLAEALGSRLGCIA